LLTMFGPSVPKSQIDTSSSADRVDFHGLHDMKLRSTCSE